MSHTASNKELAKNLIASSLSKITDGKVYNISIEEVKKLKTHKQLRFFFGGVAKPLSEYYFSIGYGIDENTPYDSEMTKLIIYKEIGLCKKIEIPSGGYIEKPFITLSEMSVEQASKFISAVIHWVDTKTDCKLPPFVRYCWLLAVDENTIQRAKDYIFPNRDPSYLNFVRSQPCIYCGRIPIEGLRNEVHHVKGVDKRCPDIIPPDWCGVPACHNCHTGSIGIQYMPPDKLQKRIPTFDFNMYMFLRLCYLRWREHK